MTPLRNRANRFPAPALGWALPALFIIVACQTPSVHPEGGHNGDDRLFVMPEVGAALSMPARWTYESEAHAVVFSEAAETEGYFTTVTMRASEQRSGESLVDALQRSYQTLSETLGQRADFHWQALQFGWVDGRPALHYALTIRLNETPHHRVGVWVDADRSWVELSYAATEALFARNVDVYERAVAQFVVNP